jgi:hypothetical protein
MIWVSKRTARFGTEHRRADVLPRRNGQKKFLSGEQVTLTYKILTQLPITQVEELPVLNDFGWKRFLLPRIQRLRIVINGNNMQNTSSRSRPYFRPAPVHSKSHRRLRTGCQTSTGGLFSLGSQEVVVRKTEPVAIKVAALPEKGKPSNFSGAVGNFKLESSVDKFLQRPRWVNLKVTLTGIGNLKTITEFYPDLPGFKIHSSKSNQHEF